MRVDALTSLLYSMARRSVLIMAVVLGVLVLYLLLWPLPFQPVAFVPPEPPPLTGSFEVNHRLAAARNVGPIGPGPEDVAFDGKGRMYSGLKDGRIIRFGIDERNPEVFARTGGRPLGLAFTKGGSLVVADARRGLLSIERDGSVRVLTSEAAERPIVFANNLAVGRNGSIYFTDSSIYPLGHFESDWMDGRPHGRLLLYAPRSHTVQVILDGLHFANSVALGPDESYVLVSETLAYRVSRYWLAGPRQGEKEIFVDNLPGFPDNISFNGRDTFWLALVWPRIPRLETLQASPFLRRIIMRLPASLVPWPEPKAYGFVLGLSLDGKIVSNLQDPSGRYVSQVSGVREYQGMLYLSTIAQETIKRLPVPSLPK